MYEEKNKLALADGRFLFLDWPNSVKVLRTDRHRASHTPQGMPPPLLEMSVHLIFTEHAMYSFLLSMEMTQRTSSGEKDFDPKWWSWLGHEASESRGLTATRRHFFGVSP